MAGEAQGSVVINVDVINKKALAAAKEVETAWKNIKVDDQLNKQVDGLATESDKAATSANKLGREVEETGKKSEKTSQQTEKTTQQTKKSTEAFDQEQAKLKTTSKLYDDLATAQDKAGNKYQASVAKLTSLRLESENVKNALTKQQDEVTRLTAKYGENSQEVLAARDKYAQLSGQAVKLEGETTALTTKVGAMTPKMAAAADSAIKLGGHLQTAGDKMSSIGKTATMTLTIPIVAGLGASAKAAVDFDSQIQNMGSLLNDGTISANALKAELDKLGDSSKKWSVQYGVSTNAINEGMTELIKKGYTYNQVLGAMPNILDASRASGEDFNTVMSVSTSTLEQFGLKSNNTATMLKNTQRVTDGLSFVANKTSAGFSDMGYAMEYVGPVAHGLNMSLEQTAAAIGLMSNQGIEGQKAGTSLRGALSALLTPSQQNMEGFKALGISVEDFKKGTLTLPDILDNIKAKSGEMTKQQLQSNLALAFGTEAQAGMNILVSEGGDALRDLTDQTKNAQGYTKSLAETMNNTAQANAQKFKESLHVLAITAGQELLPQVTELLKQGTKLIKWLNDLDKGTQQTIIRSALVVAASGPVLGSIGKLTSGIGGLLTAGPKLILNLSKFKDALNVSKLALGETATKGGTLFNALKLLGPGAAVTATSVGKLGAAGAAGGVGLLSILGPAALVVGGVTAVGTAAYFAIKAHKDHEAEMAKYKKSMDEFGVNIDSNTQKAMKSFNNLKQSASNDMAQLDTATVDKAQELSTNAVNKYSKMADLVIAQYDRTKQAGVTVLNSIGTDFGTIGETWAQKTAAATNKTFGEQTAKLNQAKQTIHDILTATGGDLSQMTTQQKQMFEDAENYIASQTSAFGIAVNQQKALYQAYVDSHNQLTDKYLNRDISQSQKAYDKSEQAAKKSYDKQLTQLKSAYKNNQITEQQYNTAKQLLLAQRNEQETKAGIELLNTQKAAYGNYRNNGETMLGWEKSQDKELANIHTTSTRQITDANGKLVQGYYDLTARTYVTRAQWIADAKKQNGDYIAKQTNDYKKINKALNDYEKSQEKAYKAMGMSASQSAAQAEVDRANMAAETTKTASQIAKLADSIHDSYIKGLQNGTMGDPGTVAKQWGLNIEDATQKVDLGKYGTKTAQEFWTDFSSGSKTGYEEAKVFFQSQLDDWKANGDTSFAKIGDSGVEQLKAGLNAGALTLKQLKPVFKGEILNLFPNDLSQASEQQINTLKAGYKSGALTLNELTGYFGDKIYSLFPDNLSSLSTKEIKTLNEGLKNGKIDVNELQNKYKSQLDAIYNQDLSKLGQSQISTLATGLKLGLPEAKDAMNKLKEQINSDATINLKGHGKENINSLISGLESGKISISDFMKGLQKLIKESSKTDLTENGKNADSTYQNGIDKNKQTVVDSVVKMKNDAENGTNPTEKPGKNGANLTNFFSEGIYSVRKNPIENVSAIKKESEDETNPTDKPHTSGVSLTNLFSEGIYAVRQNPIANALGIKNDSESQVKPTELPQQYGGALSSLFATGIINNSGLPLAATVGIGQTATDNLNGAADSASAVAGGLGSSKKYPTATYKGTLKLPSNLVKPFARGTGGELREDTKAIVGDGFEPELIDFGNNALALSPDRPTAVDLPKGAQVFSGPDTKIANNFFGSLGMPMFAEGTGGNIFNWLGNLAGDAWGWIKSIAGDVKDWVSDPFGSWAKVIESGFNLDGFKSSDPNKELGKSAKDDIKKETTWLYWLLDELGLNGSGSRGDFLKTAIKVSEGKPYVWGAAGPDSFDCSGLVMYALKQMGITFPHFSGDQFQATDAVSEASAKPGDLSFYGSGGSEHVGIVANPKEGTMWAAQSPSSNPNIGYDKIHNGLPFAGIRRIKQLHDEIAGMDGIKDAIRQAAKIMNVNPSEEFIDHLAQVAWSESGGQAGVANNWDSNAAAGQASVGLLQYIPSTFDKYAMPGHTDRKNPVDNFAAFFNNTDWQNSIGYVTYPSWGGQYKWDWTNNGPQGARRMSKGDHITQKELVEVGEVPGQDEYIINPHQDTAAGLTTDLLQRIQQVQPEALEKIALPGQNIAPELASGFRVQPQSTATVTQATTSQATNDGGVIQQLSNKLEDFMTNLSGDVAVNFNIDGNTIATAMLPKLKVLLQNAIDIDASRKGLRNK